MRRKGRSSFNWLFILVGLVASIGLCFTLALAEDMDVDPKTGKAIVQPEEDMVFEEEPGDDLEISDGSFGQDWQVTWIPCYSFTPYSSNTKYATTGNYRHFTSTIDVAMDASINLPSGAYLSIARLYYRDNDGGTVNLIIWREYAPNNWTTLCEFHSSGTPNYTSSGINIGHTIANANNMYHARVTASQATNNLSFMGLRLYWRRQIRTGLSHPFTDIGHLPQLWQDSIAALRASGITSGTSSTTYSPDMNVTRGQMAVFLAKALGLYWSYSSGY